MFLTSSILLISIILLQKNFNKVNNLAATANTNQHKESSFLTKLTFTLGAIFLVTALIISKASKSEKIQEVKKEQKR